MGGQQQREPNGGRERQQARLDQRRQRKRHESADHIRARGALA